MPTVATGTGRGNNLLRLQLTPFATCDVCCDDAPFAALLADRFRDLIDPDPRGEADTVIEVRRHGATESHPWGVWRDGEPCESTVTTAYITAYTMWEINRVVAERAETVTIHAGAVTVGSRAVLLCGASHSGKSTLTAWLAAHGCGFLTDELVGITTAAADTVLGFHRPIGMRRGGPMEPFLDPVREDWLQYSPDDWLVPASVISTGGLVSTAPVGALVFPTYTSGAPTRMTALRADDALVRLTDQSPGLGIHRRQGFATLERFVRSTPSYDLVLDDLTEATEQITAVASWR